jgi:predicted kinase
MHGNDIVLSSDELRGIICGDEADQTQNYRVFESMKAMTKYFLNHRRELLPNNIFIDATNLTKRDRKGFLDLAGPEVWKNAVVFKFDRETLLARMAGRDRVVPIEVIDRQIAKYEAPDLVEFDEILYV